MVLYISRFRNRIQSLQSLQSTSRWCARRYLLHVISFTDNTMDVSYRSTYRIDDMVRHIIYDEPKPAKLIKYFSIK